MESRTLSILFRLFVAAAALLSLCKLLGVVTLAWWVVLAPIWVPVGLVAVGTVLTVAVMLFIAVVTGWRG